MIVLQQWVNAAVPFFVNYAVLVLHVHKRTVTQ